MGKLAGTSALALLRYDWALVFKKEMVSTVKLLYEASRNTDGGKYAVTTRSDAELRGGTHNASKEHSEWLVVGAHRNWPKMNGDARHTHNSGAQKGETDTIQQPK